MSGPEVHMAETENQTSTSDGGHGESRGDANATETAPNGAGEGNEAGIRGTIPTDTDVMEMELAAAREQAAHFKHVHDTAAGKSGTKISKLQDRIRELEAGGGRGNDSYDDPSEGRRNEAAPITDPRLDTLIDRDQERAGREDRQDAKSAYNQSVARFDSKFPNLDKDISAEIGKFVQANQQDVSKAVSSGDAIATGHAMDTLLVSAMRHAISERMKGNVNEENDRVRKLNEQKRDASSPGRQAPGSGYREDRSPNTEDATLEEIKAEYVRRGRTGF